VHVRPWVIVSLAVCAAPLAAQQTFSNWPVWSPLAPRADVQRAALFATSAFPDLWQDRLPVGVFSVSGNPAGLAWELDDRSRAEFAAEYGRVAGEYRRPFDAEEQSAAALRVGGRAPAAGNGRVIGDIAEEEWRLSPGPRVDQSQPFGSSPLVLSDTTAAPMRATAVRMYGAGGWPLAGGRMAIGVSAAYDTRSLHTRDDGFVRQSQFTTPGALVGIAARLGTTADLVLGLHVGVRHAAATTEFSELAAQGQLYQLQGFREALPIEVQQSYYQRFDERSGFWGAQLSGRVSRLRWVAGAERAVRRDATTHAQQTKALVDRWRATGTAISLGLEFPIERGTLRATYHSTALQGALRMADDSTGPSFQSRDRGTTARVEVLWPAHERLTFQLGSMIQDIRFVREDTAIGIRMNLLTRMPIIGASASYAATSRGSVVFALSRGFHRANGRIPRVSDLGPGYGAFIAPEIAIYGSPASVSAVQAGFRWVFSRSVSAFLLAESSSFAPEGFALLQERPGGTRGSRRAVATIVLSRPNPGH